jgi:hypothetical protein
VLAVVAFALSVNFAFAADITIGNDANPRANVDTYQNFVIVDTNHPANADGKIELIDYYASNQNPIRFLLVDGDKKVKWISNEITPSISAGKNTYTLHTPATVKTGWNIGLYFKETGTIPYDMNGTGVTYWQANNSGLPLVGSTLNAEVYAPQTRTYSFIAYGENKKDDEDKDECKKDGWKNHFKEHRFRNQGECVSYVESEKDKKDREEKERKANGDVWLRFGSSDTHIIFNVKEEDGKVKGKLDWTRTGDYQNHIAGHVVEATGTGSDMEFIIEIDVSTDFPLWVGERLKFYVHDGGTPGTAGDTVMWQWVGPTMFSGSYGEPIVSGNLIVNN